MQLIFSLTYATTATTEDNKIWSIDINSVMQFSLLFLLKNDTINLEKKSLMGVIIMQNEDLNYFSNNQLKFSNEELKAIKKKTHNMLNKDRIIKVEKNHFWIYLVLMVLGFILVMPYVFVSTSCKVAENALSTTMSIGAGIIGAVILAYLIEWSNELKSDKDKINNYNCSIQNVHLTLWKVFMCRPLSNLNGNLSNIKPFIDQQADLYISYYEIAIRQIDTHIEQFGNLIDKDIYNDLLLVKEQLIRFISGIKNRIDANYILSLDGSKEYLEKHCTTKWLKDQWLIY